MFFSIHYDSHDKLLDISTALLIDHIHACSTEKQRDTLGPDVPHVNREIVAVHPLLFNAGVLVLLFKACEFIWLD